MNVDSDMPDPNKLIVSSLVWDLIEHSQVPMVLGMLDMIPPGPDGQTMACEESHLRMVLASPVDPQVQYLAAKISFIIMTAILKNAAVDIDEKTLEDLISQNRDFLGAGARVIVAHLIATGFLTYGRLETG